MTRNGSISDFERAYRFLMAVGVAMILASYAMPADLGTGSPPVAPVVKPAAAKLPSNYSETPKGWHEHVCSRCGTRWGHGHESYGSVSQHSCPKCGAIQWQKSPTIQLKVPCPPGVR